MMIFKKYMTKYILFGLCLLLPGFALAQSINYQAVIRAEDEVLKNGDVQLLFTFLVDGRVLYEEIHKTKTNQYGLVHLNIGEGEARTGDYRKIPFELSEKLLLKTEIDTGSGFREISTEGLKAVPFAKYADRVGQLPPMNIGALSDVRLSTPGVGEVLKWDGSNWVAGNDNVSSGGGAVNTSSSIAGDGSTENPLDLADQGATDGQTLKWDGDSWKPADDLTGNSYWNSPEDGEIAYEGKIGLNVPNPTFDIESKGNFFHEGFYQVSTNTFPAMRLRFNAQNNVFPKVVQQFTISGEQAQSTIEFSIGELAFKYLNGSDRNSLYLKANGRVGINNQNPRESLDIPGALKLGNTTNANEGSIRWTGSDFEGRKGSQWVSLTRQGSTVSTPWSLSGDNKENPYIEKGKVGIGVDQPQELLHLNSSDPEDPVLLQFTNKETGTSQDNGLTIGLKETSAGVSGVMELWESSGDLQFLTNKSPRLTIKNNGRLGIGTESPDRLFSISVNNNNSTTSQMVIEQRGGGDPFMNFSLRNGVSYALGIDNSDGDRFKIGYENGNLSGVGNKTVLEVDQSGNLEVKEELHHPITGSANLMPIAYGSFLENGNILGNRGTGNFTVSREAEGEYLVILPDYPVGDGYLVIVNANFRGAPGVSTSDIRVRDAASARFVVKSWSLPLGLPGDAIISFVVYKK